MMQKSNPLMQLKNAMQSGVNVTPLINQMARVNPRMGQAIQLMQGKRGESLKSTCLSAYKEMGVDIEQMVQQFGIQLPK